MKLGAGLGWEPTDPREGDEHSFLIWVFSVHGNSDFRHPPGNLGGDTGPTAKGREAGATNTGFRSAAERTAGAVKFGDAAALWDQMVMPLVKAAE